MQSQSEKSEPGSRSGGGNVSLQLFSVGLWESLLSKALSLSETHKGLVCSTLRSTDLGDTGKCLQLHTAQPGHITCPTVQLKPELLAPMTLGPRGQHLKTCLRGIPGGQRLGLCTSNARGPGSTLVRELRHRKLCDLAKKKTTFLRQPRMSPLQLLHLPVQKSL